MEQKQKRFAEGICFSKLFWVFLITAVLGVLIETVYCRITDGVWMNRSGLIYGQMSIVWGLGGVALTLALTPLRRFGIIWGTLLVFLAGAVLGGAFECLCSLLTETLFGAVYWDYSAMKTSIFGGRTNLMYCVAWGLLSVAWVMLLYPGMSFLIERVPVRWGVIATRIIVPLFVIEFLFSGLIIRRYYERRTDTTPHNAVEAFLDTHYDDTTVEQRWPNMINQ